MRIIVGGSNLPRKLPGPASKVSSSLALLPKLSLLSRVLKSIHEGPPSRGQSIARSVPSSLLYTCLGLAMLLCKKLCSFLPRCTIYYHCFSSPLQVCTISSKTQKSRPHFIVDYLVQSLGFSLDRALKASKYLTHLKSSQTPDSVLHFLKQKGLTDAHIRTLVSWYPRLLCYRVEKTLEPRARAILDAGFSASVLTQLLRSNSQALTLRNALPRLRFWRNFFNNDDKRLRRLFKRNRNLINYDVDKKIIPNIRLLKTYGLADSDVALILTRVDGLIIRNPDSIRVLVERTKELGFTVGSGMFVQGLAVVSTLTRARLEQKIELFKVIGWSEDERRSAFKKYPNILVLTEKNVRVTMGFLLEQAGCELSYVAHRPMLLAYSLEKRLMPRYCIVRMLKELGLKDYDLATVMIMSEEKFVKSCVLPYKEQVPLLQEAYTTD